MTITFTIIIHREAKFSYFQNQGYPLFPLIFFWKLICTQNRDTKILGNSVRPDLYENVDLPIKNISLLPIFFVPFAHYNLHLKTKSVSQTWIIRIAREESYSGMRMRKLVSRICIILLHIHWSKLVKMQTSTRKTS